jgi:hypothetical protein
VRGEDEEHRGPLAARMFASPYVHC